MSYKVVKFKFDGGQELKGCVILPSLKITHLSLPLSKLLHNTEACQTCFTPRAGVSVSHREPRGCKCVWLLKTELQEEKIYLYTGTFVLAFANDLLARNPPQ